MTKKETKKYTTAARDVLQNFLGMAPKHDDIILLESCENGDHIKSLTFKIMNLDSVEYTFYNYGLNLIIYNEINDTTISF